MTNRCKRDATWSRRDWAVFVKIEVVFWVWKVGKPWQRMGGEDGFSCLGGPCTQGRSARREERSVGHGSQMRLQEAAWGVSDARRMEKEAGSETKKTGCLGTH